MVSTFLSLLNISITASYIVLAVVLLRFVFKKAPKWIRGVFWGIVGVRLALPFSFESILSLIPSKETISSGDYGNSVAVSSGFSVVDNIVNPAINAVTETETSSGVSLLEILLSVGAYVWIIGVLAMLLYAIFSTLKISHQVNESIKLEGNVYACDFVKSPFILGVFAPKIYIPSSLNDKEAENIIAHEKAHLKRHDNLWKPLAFVILSVYWFNPLFWLAYVLLCKDIELACDEKVVKEMNREEVANYSETLLQFNLPRKMITACPVAFGEVGAKERVKNVLNYKKPAFWVIIVALVACIVASICFLTNPASESVDITDEMASTMGVSDSKVQLSMTSLSKTSITIDFINNSEEEFTIGDAYCVYEVKDKGETKLEPENDIVVHDLAHLVEVGGTLTQTYDLSPYSFEDGKTYKIYLGGFEPTAYFISFVFSEEETLQGKYVYTESEDLFNFVIELKKDGTFSLSEGEALSYLGFGHYTLKDSKLTLTEDGDGCNGNVNNFVYENGKLKFVEEGSDNFTHYQLKTGATFELKNEEPVTKTDDADTTIINDRTYSEQDIEQMYYNSDLGNKSNLTLSDVCVIDDKVYGCVGAALYWNSKEKTTNVAFFGSDEVYANSGTFAKAAETPEMKYLGDGKVAFRMQDDSGKIYNYFLTIKINGSSVKYIAEDDLEKGESTTESVTADDVISMTCKVKEINGTDIVVAEMDGKTETQSKYHFSSDKVTDGATLAVGDTVIVMYKDPIMETYPMGFSNLLSVTKK